MNGTGFELTQFAPEETFQVNNEPQGSVSHPAFKLLVIHKATLGRS